MLVMKFGGTSVASEESIALVKDIVQAKHQEQPVIAVVSALGGTTSQLIQCSQLAVEQNEEYLAIIKSIEERHIGVAKKLLSVKNQSSILSTLKLLINEIEDILRGVYLINELTNKTSDRILGYGEQLSSQIITAFLQDQGLPAVLANPKEFIITDRIFGKANVKQPVTSDKIQAYFTTKDTLFICPGFIAVNEQGEPTTLGRGGSDYTAALLAAALNAPQLEIWTDVSGMMTANPRLVRSAYAIKEISYEEAMELSHFGAKVIYPPTIQPVLEKGIPIHIKNTFQKDDYGTVISNEGRTNGQLIKGISCVEGITLLNLTGSGMVGIPNFSHRLFRSLSTAKVNVILITQASSEHSICVGIASSDLELAKEAVEEEFHYELASHQIEPLETESDLAIIALVGSNMKKQVGVSGKMFSVLGQNGVNIKAIAQGSTEKNISAVIESKALKKALNALHESFFLSEKKVLNLFIVGVGNVGRAFLNQLKNQAEYLIRHHHVELRVVALANSKKMYFEQLGINLDTWSEKLDKNGESMVLKDFIARINELNLRNSVFIDNTANETVAMCYQELLQNSVSVVTPNKIACTQGFETYQQLKATSLRYKSKFLFETNVGAGLPVINTLNDLIKSGDEILKIEAVLSGSLNFIFNNYSKDNKFVDIVKQAQVEGYTEPDPRIDLSGVDVMRKILILIRESGIPMEIDEITSRPFIPAECMEAPTVDEFFERLADHEEAFEKLLEKAAQEKAKIKYVASYDNGKAEAGLQFVNASHPLYNLEGKDNIVLFTTRRYPEQPLVIKGAGAGAEVTASGIFADIMRIANS